MEIRNTIFIAIFISCMVVESTELKINQHETCGVPKREVGLIVNGQNFTRGTLPWIVAFIHIGWKPPKFFCGGSLISTSYVISGKISKLNYVISLNFFPIRSCTLHSSEDQIGLISSTRYSCFVRSTSIGQSLRTWKNHTDSQECYFT